MKKKTDKELIAGITVIVILLIVSVLLIVKREELLNDSSDNSEITVISQESAETAEKETSVNETAETEDSFHDGVTDEIPSDLSRDTEPEKIADSRNEYYQKAELAEMDKDANSQLEELFYYWNDYQLDAVDDLIHLPRIRAISNELSSTNRYYYFGDTNKDGMPEGTGLAVYRDNAYYCGEWHNGKRSGNGMWMQIFPDTPGEVNGIYGVTDHSYNGLWKNDYPNGKGQEHISYDYELAGQGKTFIVNVIGGFREGYYDGELYIMTADEVEKQTDWEACAKKGKYDYVSPEENTMKKRPVWEKMQVREDEDNYYWMLPEENTGHGIYGLKKK